MISPPVGDQRFGVTVSRGKPVLGVGCVVPGCCPAPWPPIPVEDGDPEGDGDGWVPSVPAPG
jgi:hypothetical protein